MEAAISANQAGAERALCLEKAPEPEFGGNACYSHVGCRFVHAGAEEVREFIPQLDEPTFRRRAVLRKYMSNLTLFPLFCYRQPGGAQRLSVPGVSSKLHER